jgi:hypothetical protein
MTDTDDPTSVASELCDADPWVILDEEWTLGDVSYVDAMALPVDAASWEPDHPDAWRGHGFELDEVAAALVDLWNESATPTPGLTAHPLSAAGDATAELERLFRVSHAFYPGA